MTIIKDFVPFSYELCFALSLSFHLPVSAGLVIATEIPLDGYWAGAVCFLLWHLAVPCLVIAFALSTLRTRGKYV